MSDAIRDVVTQRRRWPAWARRTGLVVALAAGLLIAAGLYVWRGGFAGAGDFQEFDLTGSDETPVAIASAPDGTVWFTLESSDAIGRVRNGQVERIPKGSESIEPLGLAVDAAGRAWFTEAPKQRISSASPDGRIASFGLSTQVARLGRLTVASDGAVWFAEPSLMSVTRLQDGRFERHVVAALTEIASSEAAPFAVAVAPDGVVWATLPGANKLLRLAAGRATTFDVPTRASGLGDIAVAGDGAVYYVALAANKIGRFADGRFEEFVVPTPIAGLTALAVAPDGAAWFTQLRAHRLGRLHGDTITEFKLPRPDARPFGIAVDAQNNVWYTDLSGWVGRLDATHARIR
jgi:virginiamycin B lyase